MAQDFGIEFGKLVKARRDALDLTQAEVAESAGITQVALSRMENGKVSRPRKVTEERLAKKLEIDPTEIELLRSGESVEDILERIDRRSSQTNGRKVISADLKKHMDDLLAGRLLSLDEMKTLAGAFGDADIETSTELEEFLRSKAKDYEALKKEVEAIDSGLVRLSNLKSAALAAIEDVDLEEAEDLLNRVQEVELEEAAKTAELRATNALLRGKVEQAYRLLSAAADSFAAIADDAPSLRRLDYEKLLTDHGERYGGPGIIFGIQMLRTSLADIDKKKDPDNWSIGQNNLGNALGYQGARTGGEDGTRLLAEAVDAYRAALTVSTKSDYPVDWAMAQNNLGTVLQDQGARTGGEDGTRLLAEAVDAYRAALIIRTKTDHPVDWAMTKNNLGTALSDQGIRTGGEDGTRLLAEAMDAYRAALTIYTKTDHPVDWAMTLNNLGTALSDQGIRTGGEDGTRLLAEAVDAYRAALTIRTKTDHPVDWAMTQNNLGNALSDQGIRTGGEDGTRLLAEAMDAYRAALTVRTKTDHSVDWAMTQKNLANAELAIAAHDTTTDPRPHLEAALAHVDAALTIYDPEHMSYDHARAIDLRDRLLARLADLDAP